MGIPLLQLIYYNGKTKTFHVLFTAANWFGRSLVNFRILSGKVSPKCFDSKQYIYAVLLLRTPGHCLLDKTSILGCYSKQNLRFSLIARSPAKFLCMFIEWSQFFAIIPAIPFPCLLIKVYLQLCKLIWGI